MDLRAHAIEKPFCGIPYAALFLGVSLNQAEEEWEANKGDLRVEGPDGLPWTPGGRRLFHAGRIYPLLDDRGRELFRRWQKDELPPLRIAKKHRHVPMREVFDEVSA